MNNSAGHIYLAEGEWQPTKYFLIPVGTAITIVLIFP